MMIRRHNEVMVRPQSSVRWRKWVPLATQQLRLRSLVQIIAYNVQATKRIDYETLVCKAKRSKCEAVKTLFYYTLHTTTMSAPFYTSEKIDNCNPKWAEVEMTDVVGSINGVVVRLWLHRDGEPDQVVTVWGVYFSGLAYLGRSTCAEPACFHVNTIVFHMKGGYFTAPQCCREPPPNLRHTHVCLSTGDVRPSYTVNLLLRLQTIQQAMSKQTEAAETLREKIIVGGLSNSEPRESAVLRRLLNKSRPRAPQRQEVLKLKRQLEWVKFRVRLLGEERIRKQRQLSAREKSRLAFLEANQDRGSELMDRYQMLHKDIEQLHEWKKSLSELREAFVQSSAQITFRRKQLMSELNLIYPITQVSNNTFTICDVHLPNSEDFVSSEEVMISVALGFVAHVVQMISVFLQVPLRYPLYHFGSRSKIVDHVADKIPDKDREFPLYLRGKDKLQFNYGVYLLNKNIAQLRWYCGLPTQDLRATLPNLAALLALKPSSNTLELVGWTLSGSSLDLRSSSQNASPVGSFQLEVVRRKPSSTSTARHFEKGHRPCRSVGNSELLQFRLKMADIEVHSAKDLSLDSASESLKNGATQTNLSYSLDKGLDVFENMKQAEERQRPKSMGARQRVNSANNYEPKSKLSVSCCKETQNHILQTWQAAPMCSDDSMDPTNGLMDKPSLHELSNSPLDLKHVMDISNRTDANHSVNCKDLAVDGRYLSEPVFDNQCTSSTDTCDSYVTASDKLEYSVGEQDANVCHADHVSKLQLEDSVFASVAVRTAALASRTTSFNLVRSRRGSVMDDGPS